MASIKKVAKLLSLADRVGSIHPAAKILANREGFDPATYTLSADSINEDALRVIKQTRHHPPNCSKLQAPRNSGLFSRQGFISYRGTMMTFINADRSCDCNDIFLS